MLANLMRDVYADKLCGWALHATFDNCKPSATESYKELALPGSDVGSVWMLSGRRYA